MAEADNFLWLLRSFHLECMTAAEREYYLGALTDEEQRVVSDRLGLEAASMTLEQTMRRHGLPMARLVAVEMRCARRLALQDHLKQSGTAPKRPPTDLLFPL